MEEETRKSYSLEQLMPLITERLQNGQSVRFYPKGTSMLPMLRQGIDCVVLSPLPKHLKKYDLPLYKRENGQYVLHRLVRVGKTYTCIGDNQFVLEHGVRPEQMIGVVTAFARGEKEYQITDWRYRLYVRFWHYSRIPRRLFRKLKQIVRG